MNFFLLSRNLQGKYGFKKGNVRSVRLLRIVQENGPFWYERIMKSLSFHMYISFIKLFFFQKIP